MSSLIQRRAARLIAAPALIVPRALLYYRGRWNGPTDFSGHVLVEDRAGRRRWVDVQSLLEGEWDGSVPTTAMLSGAAGLWMAAGAGVPVVPGDQTWTSSGTHTVLPYNRLEVAVWGPGGGGGGANTGSGSAAGSAGTASIYASSTPLVGNPGAGGGRAYSGDMTGSGGSGGTASGGSANVTGQTGGSGNSGTTFSGSGGSGASSTGTILGALSGGAGGAGRTSEGTGSNGNPPGGGGGGANDADTHWAGGGGGGGLAVQMWASGADGAPTVDGTVTVTVQGSNVPGGAGGSGGFTGGLGRPGEVKAAWD